MIYNTANFKNFSQVKTLRLAVARMQWLLPVSNRTSDECMKSNQDHQKCRLQCTSGVFCWVHERSECTCKTRKYAL